MPTSGSNSNSALVNFLSNPPACRVTNSGSQTLNSGVDTAVLFDTNTYDTDSMHSTSVNTSRVTFNTAGVYSIVGHLNLSGETDYLDIQTYIRLNGVTTIAFNRFTSTVATTAGTQLSTIPTTYKFIVGDYIELVCIQVNTSGNSETSTNHTWAPILAATWVGTGAIAVPSSSPTVNNILNFLSNPPSVRCHNGVVTQALAHNTAVPLTFSTDVHDTDMMHSTSVNTSRITFNTAGVYTINGCVVISGETDYTSIVVFIRLNGTTEIVRNRFIQASAGSGDQPAFEITTQRKFDIADYVELIVLQENTSGNAEATVAVADSHPVFAATWIGTG